MVCECNVFQKNCKILPYRSELNIGPWNTEKLLIIKTLESSTSNLFSLNHRHIKQGEWGGGTPVV